MHLKKNTETTVAWQRAAIFLSFMYYVSVFNVYFTVYFLMYNTLETSSLFKLCFINKDRLDWIGSSSYCYSACCSVPDMPFIQTHVTVALVCKDVKGCITLKSLPFKSSCFVIMLMSRCVDEK